MRTILGTSLLLGVLALPLSAQSGGPVHLSVGPQVGAYVPAGDQRDELSDAVAAGALARLDINDYVGVVGSFLWSPSTADVPTLPNREQDIDLFQYDLGLEVRPFASMDAKWKVAPFVAVGGGGRTYSFRDLNYDAATDSVGFASLGSEIRLAPSMALRVEARGYLTDFEGFAGELTDSEGRGDFAFTAGLQFRF